MDKADRVQEQMGNVSRERKILEKNQKQMLKMKNNVTEMKDVFNGSLVRTQLSNKLPSLRK